MVMPSTNSGPLMRRLSREHPGKIGWLVGPRWRTKIKLKTEIPFALDNDAFTCWRDGKPFDVASWRATLTWAKQSGFTPLWVLVPDVVADRDATLDSWHQYRDEAKSFGWPLAFAVQDGMKPEDVPNDASVVFVGGTTDWKWRNVPMWASSFPRVHVARVNGEHRLWRCEELGIESVDGSGWFRDGQNGRKARGLLRWINQHQPQLSMNFAGQLNQTPPSR